MILVERPSLLSRLRFSLPAFSFKRPVAKVRGRVAMALKEGDSEIVRNPRPGMVVRCTHGELWITQDGDAKDNVLREGESCTVHLKTDLTILACEYSGFEVSFAD